MVNKKPLILIALFLSVSFAYGAISSGDAINFVKSENHFLYENEESHIARITHDEINYWVIRVYLEESPTTFLPVKATAKELVLNKPTNRELFKTADLLWEFTNLKNTYSAQNREWVINSSISNSFQKLGRFLSDEIFDLETIDSDLEDTDASAHINSMNSMLVSMALKVTSISQEIDEALALESLFVLEPDTSQREQLKEEFEDVFSLLDNLDSEAIDYRAKISELKQIIANSDLEAQNKSTLITMADPPQEFNSIGNYNQSAIGLSDSIDAIYAAISSRIDSLLDEFEKRIKRNQAYEILYEENSSLRTRTDGDFITLRSAADYILGEENKPYWKNKTRLKKLEDNWRKARNYFNENNYDSAIEYGNKAIDDVVIIYKDGVIDIEQPPIIPTELIMQIVIILIILLISIYAWNKREKIKGLIKWTEPGEVEIGEWQEEI